MNRPGRLSLSFSTILAVLALGLLVACGGGSTDETDTGTPPDDITSDVSGGTDTDTPPADVEEDTGTPVDVVQDVPEDVPEDVPPPEDIQQDCTTLGCEGAFDDLGPCEEAVCNEDTGECERSAIDAPECCTEDVQCDDGDPNTECTCPVAGGPCECAEICLTDADCVGAFPNASDCDVVSCDIPNGVCVKVRTEAPACCLNAAECDDGDPDTVDTCPVPGEECVIIQPVDCRDQDDPDAYCENEMGTPDTCMAARCDRDADSETAGDCIWDDLRYLDDALGRAENNLTRACCVTASDCTWQGEDVAGEWICPAVGDACDYVPPQCADNVFPFDATFEFGTLDGFEVFDLNTDDAVTWTIVEENGYDAHAIYVGDPTCGWYFNGDQVDENCETPYAPEEDYDPFNPANSHSTEIDIDLVSQEFLLPEDYAYTLAFWIAGESEPPIQGLPEDLQPDALVVSIEDVATQLLQPVFTTVSYNNVIPQPTYVAADISQYAGKAVRLHFKFDTFDGNGNRLPGWWLDQILVRSTCGPIICETNADCEDEDACTEDVCTLFANGNSGFCARNVVPSDCAPCVADSDCDSGDECSIGTCSQLGGGVCEFAPSGSDECCEQLEVVDEVFDGGALPGGWSVEDDGSDVKWQVSADPDEGRTFLYFGDPGTGSYCVPCPPEDEQCQCLRALGRVSTGPVALPDPNVTPYVSLISTWELKLSTEFDLETWNPNVAVDRLTLFVAYEEDGATVEDAVWSSAEVEGTTGDEWEFVGTELTPYAGKTVELIFEFDTDDGLSNEYGGVWIDSFTVRTICGDVCTADDQCADDGDACTVETCAAGVCVYPLAYEGCCTVAGDCGGGDICTAVTCEEMGAMGITGAGSCVFRDDNDPATCCDDEPSYSNTFVVEDLAAAGYVITEGDHGDGANEVIWQADALCARTGDYGLYFGDALFGSYQSGYQVSGTLTTPALKLPSSGADAKTWLAFDLYLDTEWNGAQFDGWQNPPALERDKLTLYVVQNQQQVEVWNSYAIDFRGSTCPAGEDCGWQTVRVDLTQYQSYSIQLRFAFDSLDDIANTGQGVCIDDLRVESLCTVPDDHCVASEDCDDSDTCTWDFCEDNACTYLATGDPNCCTVGEFLSYNWDDGTASGWDFTAPVGTVGWQVSNFTEADSGTHFLYFGDPVAESYDVAGQSVAGIASSPPIQLPASEDMTVSFAYYLDIEPWSSTFPNRDKFEVWIISNFRPEQRVLVSKQQIPLQNIGVNPPQWFTWSGAIPAGFSDDNVVFEIQFDSSDDQENTGLGILIDSFVIEAEICP